jgi:hypothetical protein
VALDISEDFRNFNTALVSLNITDTDIDASLTYTIASGDDDGHFAMQGVDLVLVSALDREVQDAYYLVVAVFDAQPQGPQPIASTVYAIINITVLDENDNAPVFNATNYACSFLEGNGSTLDPTCSVFASDSDSGDNALFNYSLVDPSGLFSIDSDGEIVPIGELDREAAAQYTLVVVATDFGAPPRQSNTSVMITVVDVDDNTPFFPQPNYTCTIPEERNDRVFCVLLQASDADALAVIQ